MAIRQNSDGSYYADEVPGQTWGSLAEAQAAIARGAQQGPGPIASTMPLPTTVANTMVNPADQTSRMLALREEILTSLRPMMTGAPGSSPATDAAIEAFRVKTLPVIQNQMALRGLNHSPAVAQVAGSTLAEALPQFITADLSNRLSAVDRAAGLIPAENQVYGTQQQSVQGATKLSADIAHQEAMRQLEGYRTAGQLQLGLGDLNLRAGQLQQEQQRLALQANQGAGGLQRDLSQQVSDAFQAERLRLQGLSEGATFGVFGGAALPPSVQQASKTTGSSSK